MVDRSSSDTHAVSIEMIARLRHQRLARECARLNVTEEQCLAEEGLLWDAEEWPAYHTVNKTA